MSGSARQATGSGGRANRAKRLRALSRMTEVSGEDAKVRMAQHLGPQVLGGLIDTIVSMDEQTLGLAWGVLSTIAQRLDIDLVRMVTCDAGHMTWTGAAPERREARDGPIPLEDQMSGLIGTFREVPERAEQRRRARAVEAGCHWQQELEAQRFRVIEAQRQAELRRRREVEQACREMLLAHARRWEEGQRLRAYLDWVRTQTQGSPDAGTEAFQGWLACAERKRLALDPVRSGELTALTVRVQRLTGGPPIEEVIPNSRR